ncbi:unnamed protein product [Urochloa humidicola]
MEGAASSSFAGGGTSSLVILSVSIVGILSTALLLLAYYLFLTRCGLLFFWRADVIGAVHNHPEQHRGLEEAAIRRIPTFRYQAHHDNAANSKQQPECAVCLGEFVDGERLRLLPPCRHAFHIDCIDAWLHATASCPLCRAPLVAADDIAIDIAAADDEEAAAAAAAEQPAPSSGLSLPLRRSLSMDSSTDKRFYPALQKIIQIQHQQQDLAKTEAADRSSSRRLRRSFFSFSHTATGSRSAIILPL